MILPFFLLYHGFGGDWTAEKDTFKVQINGCIPKSLRLLAAEETRISLVVPPALLTRISRVPKTSTVLFTRFST